jgi:uncharacterized membrane-anchored protein
MCDIRVNWRAELHGRTCNIMTIRGMGYTALGEKADVRVLWLGSLNEVSLIVAANVCFLAVFAVTFSTSFYIASNML